MKRLFLIACLAAVMAIMAIGVGSAFGGVLTGTPAESACNSVNGPLNSAGAGDVYSALCN